MHSEIPIDVREIPPGLKHPAIFQTWSVVAKGGSMLLINDHDPLPLYDQFAAEYPGRFHWDYVDRGPDIWRVRISKGSFKTPDFVPPAAAKRTSKPVNKDLAPLELDMRPLLATGGSPCKPIDDAIARLQPGQAFHLFVPFQPRPLYAKLLQLGFDHRETKLDDGTWKIEFVPGAAHDEKHTDCCCAGHQGANEVEIRLDTRQLEPPQPLVLALEALQQMERGKKLLLLTERKPMHLLDQLDERGFAYDSTELSDHSFETHVWHSPVKT